MLFLHVGFCHQKKDINLIVIFLKIFIFASFWFGYHNSKKIVKLIYDDMFLFALFCTTYLLYVCSGTDKCVYMFFQVGLCPPPPTQDRQRTANAHNWRQRRTMLVSLGGHYPSGHRLRFGPNIFIYGLH